VWEWSGWPSKPVEGLNKELKRVGFSDPIQKTLPDPTANPELTSLLTSANELTQ